MYILLYMQFDIRQFVLKLSASMTARLTRVPRVREVWSSNPGPAKSYTALQTVRHRQHLRK